MVVVMCMVVVMMVKVVVVNGSGVVCYVPAYRPLSRALPPGGPFATRKKTALPPLTAPVDGLPCSLARRRRPARPRPCFNLSNNVPLPPPPPPLLLHRTTTNTTLPSLMLACSVALPTITTTPVSLSRHHHHQHPSTHRWHARRPPFRSSLCVKAIERRKRPLVG
jgi:hypothetical protein